MSLLRWSTLVVRYMQHVDQHMLRDIRYLHVLLTLTRACSSVVERFVVGSNPTRSTYFMKRIQLLDLRGGDCVHPAFCPLSGVDLWESESPYRIMSFDWADLEFNEFHQEEAIEREWNIWLENKSELDLDVADSVLTFLSKKEVFKNLPDCEMYLVVYGSMDECYMDLLSTNLMQKILEEDGSHITVGGTSG